MKGHPMSQKEKAAYFRELHHTERPLILPNAWDAASAAVIEAAGAKAIASSSAGVAWVLGYPDGQRIPQEEMLGMIGAMVRVVDVPVTADVEAGYGDGSPEAIAETVKAVVELGAVGVNLEDTPGYNGTPSSIILPLIESNL